MQSNLEDTLGSSSLPKAAVNHLGAKLPYILGKAQDGTARDTYVGLEENASA